MVLVNRITEWGLPGGVTCRPACVETYEAKSLHIVLNIWDYSRLPDACYPVADLPCRDGIPSRWNNRPGSAAHPFIFGRRPYFIIERLFSVGFEQPLVNLPPSAAFQGSGDPAAYTDHEA